MTESSLNYFSMNKNILSKCCYLHLYCIFVYILTKKDMAQTKLSHLQMGNKSDVVCKRWIFLGIVYHCMWNVLYKLRQTEKNIYSLCLGTSISRRQNSAFRECMNNIMISHIYIRIQYPNKYFNSTHKHVRNMQ